MTRNREPPKKAGNQAGFFIHDVSQALGPLPGSREIPWLNLRDRQLAAEGLFIAEGRFLVERMLAAGCEVRSVMCLPALERHFLDLVAHRCPLHVLPKEGLAEMAGYKFHRGVLGCGVRPAETPLREMLGPGSGSVLVVCPDLNDDANVGSIIRTSVALGASGVVLGVSCCDPYGRRALRTSMGACLLARIARYRDEREAASLLREAGYTIVGAANRAGATPLRDFAVPPRVALVIGNEGHGLGQGWLDRCDVVVRIPMSPELDSLGAPVAAGILLYGLTGA
jgi:tRNA G18 (ribose-2'-O)-methylase SpoU